MQDYQQEAKRMWKSESVRQEFNNDISILEAYLENKGRVKLYQGKVGKPAKPADAPADPPADDSALKAKWQASKALRDEFSDDFESYRQYELNKNKVKIMA
jgi:hypothetical protein